MPDGTLKRYGASVISLRGKVMFKSVFQKIFVTYLSILILVMFVVSVTVSSLAENYIYSEKENTLQSVANRTNSAANAYASGEIGQSELGDIIDAMAYITDTKIYIIKADASSLEHIDLGDQLSDQYLKDALSTVLLGESVISRNQYSKGFEAPMLFAAYPWQNDTGINGAILLFSPESELESIVGNINLVIWLVAAAFVLIGGIIIYIVSKKTVAPIKAIDAASKNMAAGISVDDIEIRSKDELGNLARSFNSMKQKLEKNEKLRQDLITNISHDLRTPLTNIYGYLSGMRDGVIKTEDYQKYIAVIQKETRRLMSLTGEILDTAKVQSGNIELCISRFKLCDAVDAAITANETLADDKQITIDKEVDDRLIVNADREKTGQIIYNLINNAIKYSGSKSRVTVAARKTEKGTEICITDQGIGIAEKDLPYIFERFYRAQTGKSGYGLGLGIAKTYVESHGGQINVQSTEGKGTRVCFTLP